MKGLKIYLLWASLLLAIGCGSSRTLYLHPNADLSAIGKVAVLPFENLSDDRGAGDKVTKIFLVELLSLEAFDVAEPGQVLKVVKNEKAESVNGLDPDNLKRLGEALGVDGIFIGTVVDFKETRTGTTASPEVTIQLRLVESISGATIWSTSQTRSGVKATTRLFGIGGESLTEASRRLVREQLEALFE